MLAKRIRGLAFSRKGCKLRALGCKLQALRLMERAYLGLVVVEEGGSTMSEDSEGGGRTGSLGALISCIHEIALGVSVSESGSIIYNIAIMYYT